jgi:hypothetical protein
MNLKTIAQGAGVAILVLLPRVWTVLSPRRALVYHSFLPMQTMVWGILIDVILLTLLAALLLAYLQRSETGLRNIIWAVVVAKLLTALLSDAADIGQRSLPYRSTDLLFYGTILAALALRWLRPSAYQQATRGSRLLLLLVGCSMVWMVPELLYLALRAQPRDAQVPVTARLRPAQSTAPGDGGRIVWLLFDELSYDQTFDHRFPGLAMPNFDKLKSESVSFSDLKPAGGDTEHVLPSFFLGHIVDSVRSDLDGKPMVRLAGQKNWQAFDAHATLFSDAQRLGWTTGVVGWYNPYCRILAGAFDYCFWRMGDGTWSGISPDNSAFENAMAPIMQRLRRFQRKADFPLQEKHAADLDAVLPQAEALIRDQSIGFVFIHLSVPHPPGIYDRRPGHRRATGTYIDNLALADRTLGELMATLSATPSAAKTTLIVCSDHSWRVKMWQQTPQWTKEEETASHGRFDPRPVLMIRFPGQSVERDVTGPFDDIRIHDMIERMLRGQHPDLDKSALVTGAGLR